MAPGVAEGASADIAPPEADPVAWVLAQVARRWAGIDSLLPAPGPLPPGCGAPLIVAAGDRMPLAVGGCDHWYGEPESMDLSWGAAYRYHLSPYLAGPDVAGSLDQLLQSWRAHLQDQPHVGNDDGAAIITWPSRDVAGVQALRRHGFVPTAVIAARSMAGRGGAGATAGAPPPGGRIQIRRASEADLDALVRLGLQVIRYDALVSSVTERPSTAAALRRELAGLLAGPRPWVWLAEKDGRAIGMLAAEPPDAARWIAPMVAGAPVGYLLLMGTEADQRGTGIGAAMAARLHTEADAAGLTVMLLHYAQANPLSAPFWSQQGYRPLWTSWEASPAGTLR